MKRNVYLLFFTAFFVFTALSVFAKSNKKISTVQRQEPAQNKNLVQETQEVEQETNQNILSMENPYTMVDEDAERPDVYKPSVNSKQFEKSFKLRTVSNMMGNVAVLLKGAMGTFQFYSINKNGDKISALAGYDEFTSSFYSLRVGKKEYRLSENSGIKMGAKKTENGVQMMYKIPSVARVLVNYEILQSEPKKNADILRISVSVLNLGNRINDFALKSVLDTVLGEAGGIHFSTAEEVEITNEMQYRRFDKIKWIYSGNKKASMRILLSGADISNFEAVSLGNKDLISLPGWIPVIQHSKSFDSILSYNNSAVCLNLEAIPIEPEKEGVFIYYISFAADGIEPAGEAYINSLEKAIRKKKGLSDKTEIDSKELKDEDTKKSIDEKMLQKESELKKIEQISLDSVKQAENDDETWKQSFEYVQNLIQRINELEADPDSIDRAEILRLSLELDDIMQKLRR